MTPPCDKTAAASLPKPLITMGLEASALNSRFDPIEVGFCRWGAPDALPEVRPTIIAFHSAWTAHGIWRKASGRNRGISLAQLVDAEPAGAIA